MLEKLPESVGHALQDRRAGAEKLLINAVELQHGRAKLELSSPAFARDSRLPVRFTADGEGISPPLVWGSIPSAAATLALIVEDADSPTAEPLVHAIAVGIDPGAGGLAEDSITTEQDDTPADLGRNSFLRQSWLPPDPPPGHGVHHYAFQLFALLPGDEFSSAPGRKELINAIRQRAIGSGYLIGTYQREETVKVEEGADDAPGVGRLDVAGDMLAP
jgi:Raf kinase inhibitor-like YbhB/YbcL family protein